MTKVEEDVNEDHTENKKISIKKDEEQVEKEENIEKIEKKTDLHNLKLDSEDNIIVLISSEKTFSKNFYKIANYDVRIPSLLESDFNLKSSFDIINSHSVGVTTGILLNQVKYLQKYNVTYDMKELNNNV